MVQYPQLNQTIEDACKLVGTPLVAVELAHWLMSYAAIMGSSETIVSTEDYEVIIREKKADQEAALCP